ncbi:hypothetical protein [Amycolatopsis anabasis]|uniref:hypothetical protein n=1 Tax=Amycolatopsis anabasis TaxID=1840409 RepID=UPI001C556544|nr:hypothetical protein [Amycolatopsis anabasis]
MLGELTPQQVERVVRGVSVSFVFAAEDAGDEFEVGPVVVGKFDEAELLSAGESSVDDGLGDGAGGEQAAVEEVAVEQAEAVVERVDVGDDVEGAAVVGPVPAAQEFRQQSGGEGE